MSNKCAAQDNSDTEWQPAGPNKHRVIARKPGRPRKLDLPEKGLTQDINMLFSQASSMRSAIEAPASTQETPISTQESMITVSQ